jgi:hypothetical protein
MRAVYGLEEFEGRNKKLLSGSIVTTKQVKYEKKLSRRRVAAGRIRERGTGGARCLVAGGIRCGAGRCVGD